MISSPFPIIPLVGGPYDQGIQYGSRCKELISRAVEIYRAILKRHIDLGWEECSKKSREFIPFIEEYDKGIMDCLRGIAQGSERSLEDILVLNIRTELVFLAYTGKGFDGCTSLAVMPESTRSKEMLMGQNWDWKPVTQALNVILKIKQDQGPSIVTMVEAGIVGKFGFNSAGIGLCANALISDGWRVGVPAQIIFRKILNSETIADAISAITAAKRASASNYLVGRYDPVSREGDAVDIEAAPDAVNFVLPENGLIAHSNHFTVSNERIKDFGPSSFPNTILRVHRTKKLLVIERGDITAESVKGILSDQFDRPNSICWQADPRLPEEDRIQTNASFVLSLDKGRIDVAKGPPCDNEYISLDFGEFFKECRSKETSMDIAD